MLCKDKEVRPGSSLHDPCQMERGNVKKVASARSAEKMGKVVLDYAARNHAAHISRFESEISLAVDESEASLRFHFET